MPIKPLNLNIAIQRSPKLSIKEKELTQKLLDTGYDFMPLIARSTSNYSPSSQGYWSVVMGPNYNQTYDFSRDDSFRSGPWLFGNVKDWIEFQENKTYEEWLIEQLSKKGIKLSSTKELTQTIIYNLNNNGDYITPLSSLLSQMNLGSMRSEMEQTLLNKNNGRALFQAINLLGYAMPENADAAGISKMKLIYWAVYYLRTFPIPLINATNCSQIQQTLIQLEAEKATIKAAELDRLFGIYTETDWNQRQQAVSDLSTNFNGIYGRLNCTKAQVKESLTKNNTFLYALIGGGVIILGAVIYKMRKK